MYVYVIPPTHLIKAYLLYWLGDEKDLINDNKTPPTTPPTASVDDSKVKRSTQEWLNIAGEAIPSVHYSFHFLCRREQET